MDSVIWKPVVGYEGLYEVSNLGQVKRVARKFINSSGLLSGVSEMIMKEDPKLHSVILYKDGQYRNVIVRSIVCEAFLGIPYGEPVSHIDRDISNSRLDNLVATSEFRQLDPDWKDIPGWEGYYQASRFGHVRSVDRYVPSKGGSFKYCPGCDRVEDDAEGGYLQVALYRGKEKPVTKHIHQFVAQAWIPNPENKPTVNHLNGNKHDNKIENLEWATYAEQQAHAVRTGLRKYSYWDCSIHGPVGGDWNERQKVKVRCIETGQEFESMTEAGEAFGTGASEVQASINHHSICKGFHFVRASEPDYTFGVQSLPDEVWKPIPKFEDRYLMSSKGRVKSVERQVKTARGQRTVPEKLINLTWGLVLIDSNGQSRKYDFDSIYFLLFSQHLNSAANQPKQKKLFNIG